VLRRLLSPNPPPFAVLHRPEIHADAVEVLLGDLITVGLLADLPEPEPGVLTLPVLAVVPFRQIRERGFEAVDDEAPMLALQARQRVLVSLDDLLPLLPEGPQSFTETGYDVPDDEYERTVRAVLEDEIAAGAGSNFVIHRCLTGRIDPVSEPPARAALGALKRLLLSEHRAYWTFVVHTPERTFVGATPERHVSLDAGIARMNPISGTLRYPPNGWASGSERRDAVLRFLADPKERDELAMVVDEELKMMAVVGDRGGRVRGPYLKEMAHLAHTEYVLEGRTSFDARRVLAATMFAPTVTGSPIRNACRVIARHERRGRRYYGGVLALIGRDAEGRQSLDAPILIRTAEIATDGTVRVAAGATLVRGSRPESELAETGAKAAAILAALTGRPKPGPVHAKPGPVPDRAELPGAAGTVGVPGTVGVAGVAGDAGVRRVLADRNRTLAQFWLQEQAGLPDGTALPGPVRPGEMERCGRITVIDAEDDFTGMLAHLLGSLGFQVEVRPWHALVDPGSAGTPARPGVGPGAGPGVGSGVGSGVAPGVGLAAEFAAAELVVLGPGPGDPRDTSDPRILALHGLAKARLAANAPTLGICLGHQILAHSLGLRLRRLPRPDQGRQIGIDLFGIAHQVGFYNSFVVHAPDVGTMPGFAFSLDAAGEQVYGLRGEAVTGLQFHPESVLTTDGLEILDTELARLSDFSPGQKPREAQ
jgi:phenazine biosynthesis protein phzE